MFAKPATMLLRNHLRAGDWEFEPSMVENPSFENGLGIQLRGNAVVAVFGLSEVESIHKRGATNISVRRIRTAYDRILFARSPVFRSSGFAVAPAISVLLLLAQELEVQDTYHYQEERQDVAHRRRAPHPEVLEALLRYVHDCRACLVVRTALGDEVGLTEHVCRGENRHRDYEQYDRAEPR